MIAQSAAIVKTDYAADFFARILEWRWFQLAKSGLPTARGSRAADWIGANSMWHILAALTAPNRRIMELCICTGLRISDAISLKTAQFHPESLSDCRGIRIGIRQQKDNVYRRVWVPFELRAEIVLHAGRMWAFESRCAWTRHRTRQAVEKDMKRARTLLRVPKSVVVSPHSARKIFAVEHSFGALHHKSKLIESFYNESDARAIKKMRRCSREDLLQ